MVAAAAAVSPAGAVYTAVDPVSVFVMLVMVPTVELPSRTPFTNHPTAVLLLPVTVAVKVWVWLAITVALSGVTATAVPPALFGTKFAVAAGLTMLVLACHSAVMETEVSVVKPVGAVYKAVEPVEVDVIFVIVPTVALPSIIPFTNHPTVVLLFPLTVAVNV
jgi:hypothetical protein